MFGVVVDGGGASAGGDAGRTAEQHVFGEKLDADVALGGAERAAEPDFGAAFEHGDDHNVGDADGADQEGHRAQAEEQSVEGGFCSGAGDQRVGGLGDGDLSDLSIASFPPAPVARRRPMWLSLSDSAMRSTIPVHRGSNALRESSNDAHRAADDHNEQDAVAFVDCGSRRMSR